MVNTTAAHQHTGGDPHQPCGKCHKRHVRAGEGVAPSSQPSNQNRRGLFTSSPSIKKTAGIAALFLSAITHPASAAAVTGSQPSSAVVASEPSRQHIFDGTAMSSVLASLWGDINHIKFTNNNRLLQAEEDDHDHADEIHSVVGGANETDLHDLHADEHHDEPGHADEHLEDIDVEHHDEHDHDELHQADEAAAMKLNEADGHDDHGHDDEHDEHGDEHDEHDNHGDEHDDHGDVHDDHGHGEVSNYFIPQHVTPFSLDAYILLTPFMISYATY